MSRNVWTKIYAQTLKTYIESKNQTEGTFLKLLFGPKFAKPFSED